MMRIDTELPDVGHHRAMSVIDNGKVRFLHGNPWSHAVCKGLRDEKQINEWYEGVKTDIRTLREELGLSDDLFYFINRMARPILMGSGSWQLPTVADLYEMLFHRSYSDDPEVSYAALKQLAEQSAKLVGSGESLPKLGEMELAYHFEYGYQEGTVDFILWAKNPPEIIEAANVKQIGRTILGDRHFGQYLPKNLPLYAVRLLPVDGSKMVVQCVQRIIEPTGTITASLAQKLAMYPQKKDLVLLPSPKLNVPIIENIKTIFSNVPEKLLKDDRLLYDVDSFGERIYPKAIPLFRLMRTIPGDYCIKLMERELNGFPAEEMALLLCLQVIQGLGFKTISAPVFSQSRNILANYFDHDPTLRSWQFLIYHAGRELGISPRGIQRIYENGANASSYLYANQNLLQQRKYQLKKRSVHDLLHHMSR